MTPERLANIKVQVAEDLDWFRRCGGHLHFDGDYAARVLPDLIAEIERLRAELQKRCEYLDHNQFTFWEELWSAYRCWKCGNKRNQGHAPDCRHARLMKMPEGV